MYNPKSVLTKAGYSEYEYKIAQLREAVEYFISYADDLHIGCNEGDDSLDTLYRLAELSKSHLLSGDGEIYDPGYIMVDGKVIITHVIGEMND